MESKHETLGLDALKRLAEGATRGKWGIRAGEDYLHEVRTWPDNGQEDWVVADCGAGQCGIDDAAYVAAMNPAMALALIERVRVAEDRLTKLGVRPEHVVMVTPQRRTRGNRAQGR